MDSTYSGIAIILFAGVASAVVWSTCTRRSSSLPLPPGPPPLPLIGNLLDMPTRHQWLVFDKWVQDYGDIVHVSALGKSIVILGSQKRIADIFEKRSTNYSDRIQLPMMQLIGWDFSFGNMSYSPWWRRHRKCFTEHFNQRSAQKYQHIQLQESRVLLRRLLHSPEDFMHHVKLSIAAIIVKITYGITIADRDNPYFTTAEEAMNSVTLGSGVPGTFLVDLLPILRFVPAWLPGAGFKRKAAHWRKVLHKMIDQPFYSVKGDLANGVATSSIAATLLESMTESENREEEEFIAKQAMGAAYAGGSDTTASSLQCFILAMAIYPEVQRKAQAELDAVVGYERLPDFNDRELLPYINAVVKEVIRWQPVAPLAVAHSSVVDDEYDGYFIPAKTIVVGNSWTVLHDPEMYHNPEEFNPDRFLKGGELNDEIRDPTAAFGFGRRACPGAYLARNTIYSFVAAILSVFNIEPPLDKAGHVLQLTPQMSPDLLSFPLPFKCKITPRSDSARSLIRESQGITESSRDE